MLAEMKFASIILFIGIGVFLVLFLVQLMTLGTIENQDATYEKYYRTSFDLNLVTALNIVMFAVFYHVNLFNMMNSLGAKKSNKSGLKAISIALGIAIPIFLFVGILSIYTFGSAL